MQEHTTEHNIYVIANLTDHFVNIARGTLLCKYNTVKSPSPYMQDHATIPIYNYKPLTM